MLPLETREAIDDYLRRTKAKLRARPAYQSELLKKERRFFDKVVAYILQFAPNTTEILLHGSRAINEHKRTSDWDFVAFVPALTVDQQISLVNVGGPFGKNLVIGGRRADIQVECFDARSNFVTIAREEGVVVWRYAS